MTAAHRMALHRIPELDRVLPETAEYLKTVLSPLGCTLFFPWESAVCAYFDYGRPETVAFRADMDALPICEATGLPFASEHAGKMHACGHDGHMAILLALAEHLARVRMRQTRNVLLIFQPAEETTGGARALCDCGILEKHHVTSIYGLHLWPELAKGTVAACAGGQMARSCELTVEIEGKSAHIAHWRDGNDALYAASRFLDRAYRLAEGKTCVLRFGRLESGTVRNADRKSTRLNSSHQCGSRMPSSA